MEEYSIKNTTSLKGILSPGIVLCYITSHGDYELPFISFMVRRNIGIEYSFLVVIH